MSSHTSLDEQGTLIKNKHIWGFLTFFTCICCPHISSLLYTLHQTKECWCFSWNLIRPLPRSILNESQCSLQILKCPNLILNWSKFCGFLMISWRIWMSLFWNTSQKSYCKKIILLLLVYISSESSKVDYWSEDYDSGNKKNFEYGTISQV